MADINQTVKVIIEAQNQTQAAFGQINSSLNNLKSTVIGLGTALVGALSFRDVIDSTRAWGNEVDRLQDELGGSAEQMSALNAVGRSVGLTTDELSQTFGVLNKRISDSVEEIGRGTSVFDRWGVSLKDANGNVVGFDEAMRRIKARFQEIGQGAHGTALLLDIFGRSGKSLSDFLALSDAEMKDMIATARDFGLILGEEGVAQIAAFNRQLYRFDLQIQGIKLQIGQFFLPLLTALLERIRQAAGFFKALGDAVGRMLAPFKEWIDRIGGIKAVADALLTLGVALIGLAAVGGLIALVGLLTRLAVMAAPLVAIAAGIAVIALALKDLEEANRNMEPGLDLLGRQFGNVGAALIGLSAVMLAFNAPAAIVLTALGAIGLAIGTGIQLVAEFTGKWELWREAAHRGLLENQGPIGVIIQRMVEWGDAFNVLGTITQMRLAQWTGLFSEFGALVQRIGDGIGSAMRTALDSVVSAITGAVNTAIALVNALISAVNRVPGVSIPTIPQVQGPASGAAPGGPVIPPSGGENAHPGQVFLQWAGVWVSQSEYNGAAACESGGGQWSWTFLGGAGNCFYPNSGGDTFPTAAEGGIVMPRPGGTLVNVGEAGQAEAIIPLSRMHGGGAGSINVGPIYVSGNVTENERELADTIADVIMRRLFAQRQFSF